VDQMSIGEFARQSRLSAKALRLYDELGLLPPAQVDEDSGYRFYEPGQLKQARLIAALRQLQVPLAEIKAILPLVASVRRRRRDLAILKALGFTRRQLLSAVCWQASILVGIGVIVAIPLGIVLGRWTWMLFARDIYVVPQPSVPVVSLVFVVIGALAFANLVAALPGRIAARTPAAIVFRSE
jgi:DNA-binding transcriptional MerR regulator